MNYWFDDGFDERVKAFIKNKKISNQTLSCQNESRRWARILLAADLEIDIEIHDGMYLIDGDPNLSEGHTWLEVDGLIFDPTAAQFETEIDSSNYEIHETESVS